MPEKAMILLAEPEDAIRESIELILKDEGYDCHPVSDRASLLRAVDLHDSDLIIADINLMHSDTGEVIAALKEYSDPPPILVLLTYERIRDMLDLIGFGTTEYLIKPFTFEDLVERVHKIIHAQD